MSNEELKPLVLHGTEIASLWFNHNDQKSYNSMDATFKFLKKATKKGEKEGYKNIRVEPISVEGDENNLEQYYLKVIGDRTETKEEFKNRMKSMLAMEKRSCEEAERRHEYYQSEAYEYLIEELKKLCK